MTLVSTNWLNQNLNKVKIIDASWHLVKNRNAIEEYNKEHIENAIFFDLDKNSNQKKTSKKTTHSCSERVYCI